MRLAGRVGTVDPLADVVEAGDECGRVEGECTVLVEDLVEEGAVLEVLVGEEPSWSSVQKNREVSSWRFAP